MLLANPQRRFVNLFSEYSLTANTGVVTIPTAGTTDLLLIPSFDCIVDTFVLVSVSLACNKGGADGREQMWIYQKGGTGEIRMHDTIIIPANQPRPRMDILDHSAASWRYFQNSWTLRCTKSGTIELCWNGNATGSDASVAIGDMSMELFIFL